MSELSIEDSYLRIVSDLNADGMILFQLFGCHSISKYLCDAKTENKKGV